MTTARLEMEKKCVGLYDKLSPDPLLPDLRMPKKEGLEWLQKVEKMIPIIASVSHIGSNVS
jgi:YesN/AraC family two-component response regulator